MPRKRSAARRKTLPRALAPDRPDRPEPSRQAEGDRALAAALWALLAVLVLARALLSFSPTMWAWSLNLQRFLAPPLAWSAWAAAALALLPPLARRAVPLWDRAGERFRRHPNLSAWLAAALLAALVLALPDRVRFVGDFLLRQGTVEVAERPSQLFPQALPLDVLLHYSLPRYLSDGGILDANGAARALGAAEAAALAALAVLFARVAGARGAAAVAVAAVVCFGGYLGMFTGFSKAFAEMCLLVAMTGAFGLRAIREGRGLLPLGLAVALGVTLHRSALGLVPAALVAWGVWLLAHGREGGWRRRSVLLAAAAPLLALAVMLPRIVAVVRQWDALHFAPDAVREQGGVAAAALAGARAVDLPNLVVLLSPLSPLLLLLPAVARRASRTELLFLATLALPFVAVMPFLHPAQGLFRDWDDFAATGVAVSLLVGWTAAQALRLASPRASWLAVAATLAVVAPSFQWLAHHADVDHGFARVRAFMVEPPPRTPRERGTTWDYLGIRNFRLDRFGAAAEAFEQAALTAPSPRILQEWALAETMNGDHRQAQSVYFRMLAKAPENVLGWLGLATVSTHLGDWRTAARAARRVLDLEPSNRIAAEVLARARAADTSGAPGTPAGAAAGGRP